MDVKALKQKLIDAGVEIYRARANEIHVAERVRLHIMDSGVRVTNGEPAQVVFVARAQRSDFSRDASDDALFERVRAVVGAPALSRGYREVASSRTEAKDPVDASRTLDVWHEVSYSKSVSSLEEAVLEVQWVLSRERYVAPAT